MFELEGFTVFSIYCTELRTMKGAKRGGEARGVGG